LISYQGPFVAYAAKQPTDVVVDLKQKKLAEIDAYFVVSAASADHQRIIEVLQQHAKVHSCSYLKGCG
jgi:20S proteasome alpha/beta subunit